MAPHTPIVLILGYGANIGAAVARRFRGLGYEVAVVSRGDGAPSKTPEGYLALKADLADASAYEGIYGAVSEAFSGGAPNVVVFNAASVSPAAEPGNLFSVPLEGLRADLDLSVTGAFVAAREAFRLWGKGDDKSGGKKQFIYTGNKLTKVIAPAPDFATLGTVKNASAYWLGAADKLYKEKGIRFFVADQRNADGSAAGRTPDAEAHAELYTRLARDPDAWPFYITFVDGTKVVNFEPGKWE